MSAGFYSRIHAMIALTVIAIIASFVVPRFRNRNADRLAEAMKWELMRQGVDSLLERRLQGVTDPAEAGRISAELSRRGIARLTKYQLKGRMALLLHMDSLATVEQCAARFMGTLAPAESQQLLGALDSARLEQWVQFSAYAIGQELSMASRGAVIPATDQEVADAFATVTLHVPAADRGRYTRIMMDPTNAPAADKCWAALMISKTTLAMPDPPQGTVLLTLARVEAGI